MATTFVLIRVDSWLSTETKTPSRKHPAGRFETVTKFFFELFRIQQEVRRGQPIIWRRALAKIPNAVRVAAWPKHCQVGPIVHGHDLAGAVWKDNDGFSGGPNAAR